MTLTEMRHDFPDYSFMPAAARTLLHCPRIFYTNCALGFLLAAALLTGFLLHVPQTHAWQSGRDSHTCGTSHVDGSGKLLKQLLDASCTFQKLNKEFSKLSDSEREQIQQLIIKLNGIIDALPCGTSQGFSFYDGAGMQTLYKGSDCRVITTKGGGGLPWRHPLPDPVTSEISTPTGIEEQTDQTESFLSPLNQEREEEMDQFDCSDTDATGVLQEDCETLSLLYSETGGEEWTRNDNWKTIEPVSKWYGITVTDGEVVRLDLVDNNLRGEIPGELENFENLAEIALWGNDGLSTVTGKLGVKVDRAVLRELYEKNNGENWENNDNWFSGETEILLFSSWHGVETNEEGRVSVLNLGGNGLSGELTVALGSLSALEALDISDNEELAGELPEGLRYLSLKTLDIRCAGVSVPEDLREWLGGIEEFHEGCAESPSGLVDSANLEESSELFHSRGMPGLKEASGGCAIASEGKTGVGSAQFNLLLIALAAALILWKKLPLLLRWE